MTTTETTARACTYCAEPLPPDKPGPGRPRRTCGDACRTALSVLRRTGHRTLTRAQRRRLGF